MNVDPVSQRPAEDDNNNHYYRAEAENKGFIQLPAAHCKAGAEDVEDGVLSDCKRAKNIAVAFGVTLCLNTECPCSKQNQQDGQRA